MTTSDTPLIVIGLGTGRCGTNSLAELLDAAGPGRFTHELAPHLPWDVDLDLLDERIEVLTSTDPGPVGDVGFYYLPYVVPILDRHPHTRFIALRRDRSATVRSYLTKTAGRNHWMHHDGTEWQDDPVWDLCYPTYDETDLETAIGRYWDEYYAEVSRLREVYPEAVRLWDMAALNDGQEVEDMLSFAGLEPDAGTGLVSVRANPGRPPLRDRARAALQRIRRT